MGGCDASAHERSKPPHKSDAKRETERWTKHRIMDRRRRDRTDQSDRLGVQYWIVREKSLRGWLAGNLPPASRRMLTSDSPWATAEILITGHHDGQVSFWNIFSGPVLECRQTSGQDRRMEKSGGRMKGGSWCRGNQMTWWQSRFPGSAGLPDPTNQSSPP